MSYFLGRLLLSLWTLSSIETIAEDTLVGFSSPSVREESGKKIMDEIVSRSKMPQYGECWTAALGDLQVACKVMDSEMQGKLALAFTSCFVEMMGFPPYMCDKGTRFQECVKHLDDRGYKTFLEYFLHTQDMCFFLMNQLWQEETDRTVNHLASAAHGVTKNLQVSIQTQDKILASQQESLKVQGSMVKDNNALYQTIIRVKEIFDEFRLSVDDHQEIFRGIFDKLEKMQQLVSWIQGEMSVLDMIGCYFTALFFGYFVTCTRQTSGARFPLLILMLTTGALERALYSLLASHNYTPEDINDLIGNYRRCAAIIGFIICLISWWMYRDNESHVQQKLDKLMLMFEESRNEGRLLKNGSDVSHESESDSDTSGFDKDSESESSDSSCRDIDPSEQQELMREMKLYSNNKENKPLSVRNNVLLDEDDLPHGPPVLSSTPKDPQLSVSRYNLRQRKNNTPTNPIVNQESPREFAMVLKGRKLLVGERNNKKKKPNPDRSSFYSSADEL